MALSYKRVKLGLYRECLTTIQLHTLPFQIFLGEESSLIKLKEDEDRSQGIYIWSFDGEEIPTTDNTMLSPCLVNDLLRIALTYLIFKELREVAFDLQGSMIESVLIQYQ